MDIIVREELDAILADDPNLCFCEIPAYRSFTLEHGPILECGKYDTGPLIYCGTAEEIKQKTINDIEKKMTCGFHVHEISWNLLRRDLRNGKIMPSEINELKSCSLYNLTYCSSFYLVNNLIKEKLTSSPECFCGRPGALRIFPVRLDGGGIRSELRFTCQESRNPNAKKCNWRLPFKEATFSRPITPSHTVVDIITYYDLVNQRLVRSHTIESQHRMDLLAALTAKSSIGNLSTLSTGTAVDEQEINQHSPAPLFTHGHSYYTTDVQSPSTNHSYNTPVVSYDLGMEEQNELCRLCLGSGIVNSGYPCQHCGL